MNDIMIPVPRGSCRNQHFYAIYYSERNKLLQRGSKTIQ
jgi:hypothetical protein